MKRDIWVVTKDGDFFGAYTSERFAKHRIQVAEKRNPNCWFHIAEEKLDEDETDCYYGEDEWTNKLDNTTISWYNISW